MKDVILLLHPAFGILAILAAVWVFVDALNSSEASSSGKKVSIICTVLIWLTYLIGGYWYVVYYGADKAIIKAGPWPFGHSFFMEVKEHVFLMLLILATYLPIASFGNTASHKGARKVVLWVSGLIVTIGLSMEGAGAIISAAVKIGLLSKGQGG